MNSRHTRRKFTQEFKEDAVSLVIDYGYSCTEVARRLGIPDNNVSRWVRLHHERTENESGADLSREQLEAGLKRLQRENKRLEMEREMLKMAAAFYANEPK